MKKIVLISLSALILLSGCTSNQSNDWSSGSTPESKSQDPADLN